MCHLNPNPQKQHFIYRRRQISLLTNTSYLEKHLSPAAQARCTETLLTQINSVAAQDETKASILALPSLVAIKCGGAALAVATDYPDEDLLANIQHNAGLNFHQDPAMAARFKVRGYRWGTDVASLLELNAGAPFAIRPLWRCKVVSVAAT